MREIDPVRGKVLSERRILWHGNGAHLLEAPHGYRIGVWCYLLTTEGGTFQTHMAPIARSRQLWGPCEGCPGNPVPTNLIDPSWQVLGAGHADLFEDASNNWWRVHLGSRLARHTMGHLGWETFLTPVRWEHG